MSEITRNYATLFDHRYAPRGIVLYQTLMQHSSVPFNLHVLCLTKEARRIMEKLSFSNVIIYDLESKILPLNDLTKARSNRTWQEFCWTVNSVFCAALINAGYQEITSLDADMFFLSDPEVIFKEIKIASIAIIPHRFIPEKQQLEANGKFNVSWVTFRDTPRGKECVNTWAKQCLDWCYYTVEKDRFADQKYLDKWPGKYG
jgi:hypothetical protein